MTALKAHQVDGFVSRPDLDHGFFLVYGPDNGLVRERARRLVKHFAGADPDPMAMTTLDMGELTSDPERLAVEACTPSLFGGARVVRVREATAAVAPTLEELFAQDMECVVVLEAGNLTPRDKLRDLAEKQKHARALPCYADSERDLDKLIRTTFEAEGIRTEPDTMGTLRDLLGNDREVTRLELEKLILFAHQTKQLTTADVVELCGDNTALNLDQIVDSTATGHAVRLEAALGRAFTAGTEPNRVLAVAQNHFAWLRSARARMQTGHSAADVLKSARPRPHFSRTRSIEQQLRLWDDSALGRAGNRLLEATHDIRRTGQLPETVTRRALLALCIMAAQR